MKRAKKALPIFLGLERKQQYSNTINRITYNNYMTYTDNENVIKCIYNFYSSLYSGKNASEEEVEKYLNDTDCEYQINSPNLRNYGSCKSYEK